VSLILAIYGGVITTQQAVARLLGVALLRRRLIADYHSAKELTVYHGGVGIAKTLVH